MYTLLGSQTSPFVRRIRLLMEDIPYELKEMDIFGEDALTLKTMNPVNQIPVLITEDQKIWDSRQIFNYLNVMHRLQNMEWHDENMLTAIDGAMGAGVNLLLLKRSGIDINQPLMFIQRQRERIESVLDFLKPYMEKEGLENWDFLSMSLYSFLDWATFREIISISEKPHCQNFLARHAQRPSVIATQIPKG